MIGLARAEEFFDVGRAVSRGPSFHSRDDAESIFGTQSQLLHRASCDASRMQ
jgi:hypothetical protein